MNKKLFFGLITLVFCFSLYLSNPLFAKIKKEKSCLMYKKKITIDHTKVLCRNQKNFPVLICLTDPALRLVSHGGHVAQSKGDDIFFVLTKNKTELAHEIIKYNPDKGELKAWVKVPFLSSENDTELYLYYGNSEHALKYKKSDVWDSHYKIVKHLNGIADHSIEIPSSSDVLNLTKEITVEAWCYSENYQAEALQPLVSKWDYLKSFNNFSAYDASKTDNLDCRGYFGAVFDGRYIYFSPQRNGNEKDSTHGVVLRYDTQKSFKEKESWEAYDAGNTDGMKTKGHYGAVFDGRYVYFVPRGKNYKYTEFQSRIQRYDTHKDFKDSESWEAFDIGVNQTHQAAGFDGRYIYLCPGYRINKNNKVVSCSNVIRFDTKAPLKDTDSYNFFDVSTVTDIETGNYDGAAFDGRYMYFVPLVSGVIIRYDTKGNFRDKKNWQVYNAKPFGMKLCVGAIFDGKYLYFVPYNHSAVIRYDTNRNFDDKSSWNTYDAINTKGLDTGGYDGGFFDGRYVYFAPFTRKIKKGEKKSQFHTNFLRYDTCGKFDNPDSWDSFDASKTDNLETIGYNAGAFDGRYFYLAPWQYKGYENAGVHGRILRYDTVGENASFSLRYCDYGHNGGLCAALPGPSFLVNTQKGVLTISANKVLVPGWHHIVGVYNGKTMKLFIDGVLIAERTGSGLIQKSACNVEIGGLQKSSVQFKGIIDKVRISNVARNDDWIKTGFLNLVNPADFIHVGCEMREKYN